MYPLEDTIIAIASAPGKGGVRGILRLSGPKSWKVMREWGIFISQPGRVETSLSLEGLDWPVICYAWEDGKSYTGQEAVELHTVGAIPFLERLMERFCEGEVRLAQPGEFTLRAFLSGRLDLTQAEAVLGVIDATQESRLQTALSQLAGGLSQPLQELRNLLWELLEHLEAGFDFADEDIAFITSEEIRSRLEMAYQKISQILEKTTSRGQSDHLLRVVLYGPPNIGKSRLFNTLLAEEKAIVYDMPGTTRDYLTARWEWQNDHCLLVDTAGDSWQQESEFLSRQSQKMARTQQEQADIRILCWDAREIKHLPPRWLREENALVLAMRCDLLPIENRLAVPSVLYVSSQTGEGLEEFQKRLAVLLQERSGAESEMVASTEIRCRDSLIQAHKALQNAFQLCDTPYEELLASEVRVALEHLGRMVGAIYTEDLLDSIFSRFCVGK